MAPSKPIIPAYESRLYDLCDVIDALAASSGKSAADRCTQRLLGQVAKEYPRSAARALGAAAVAGYGVTYKQTQDASARIDRAVTTLRGKLGDDQVAGLIEALGRLDAATLAQVVQQLGASAAGSQGGVGTLTSDQKPSRTKAAPATHGLARLFDEGIKELK